MKQEWTGPHDDSAPVGDGVTVFENVFTGSKREIQLRPGWTNYDTWSASFLGAVDGSNVFGVVSGNIYNYNVSSKVKTNLGAYSTFKGYANSAAVSYIVGSQPSVVTSTTLRTMGLAAPAKPTITSLNVVGTPTLGTHLVRLRSHVYDSTFNRYSDPSEAQEVVFRKATLECVITSGSVGVKITDPGSGYRPGATYTITFTGDGTSANGTVTMRSSAFNNGIYTLSASGGSGYTYCTATISDPDSQTRITGTGNVEITLSNGELYYANEQTTSGDYNINDDEMIGWENVYMYAGPDGYGHELPPTGYDLICSHRNRLFMWNGKLLTWSRAGFPESWKSAEWSRKVSNYGSDDPTAMFSVFDDLYLCSLRGMKRFVYVSDPANAMIVDLPTQLGVFNQNCVVFAEGRVFGFGPNGVWEIQGIKPNLIGHVLDNQWRPICDFTRTKNQAFGYYDQKNRRIVWYFVKTGDTTCKVGQCIDIETGIFSMITTDQELSSALQVGYGNASEVFATSTSSVFQQTNTRTDGTYPVAMRILSDWNSGGDVDRRAVDYLRFETLPYTSQPEYRVSYYFDGSDTPYDFGTEYALTSTPPDGVSINPSITTELLVTTVKGFAAVPAPREWRRFLRYEIKCNDPSADIHLLDVDFQWTKAKKGSEA